MDSPISIEPTRIRRWGTLVVGGLVSGTAACTLLLNHNAAQCHVDADCERFGHVHPYCVDGACVDSHLGPPGCYYGTPSNTEQFLNQCSTSSYFMFDDCTRLPGFCNDGTDGGPPLISPPQADSGVSASDASTDASTDASGDAPSGASDAGRVLPNCAELGGSAGVVYITGSSNFPTALKQVAPLILGGAPPLGAGPTPVFLTTNSCTGVKSVFSTQDGDHVIHDPAPGSPDTRYAQYYQPDGGSAPCLLGRAGQLVDIGESDVYSATCKYTSNSINDSIGPIQAMAFVVPSSSSEDAISHEAAREVFGMGGNRNRAAPWTNPDRYYVRNPNTGTQQMIGLELGIYPGAIFWGADQGSAKGVHDKLQALINNSAESEQAIGIISVDVYDSDRSNLKVLAYKESSQAVAYLPDSTADSFDKQNVRDGHYPIWGPVHFFPASTTDPTRTANQGAFLNFWSNAGLNRPVIDAFIAASLVPECAMAVQRDQEVGLGEVIPFTPVQSCACYFNVASALKAGKKPPPECTTCQADDDCPTAERPHCSRLNYCETR